MKWILSCAIVAVLLSIALMPTLQPVDDKEDLYVFALFGQSNAAYHYEDVDLVNRSVPPVPAGTAFYFGKEARPILHTDSDNLADCGIYDMCPNGSWTIGNIEASFAKSIVESGRKVLVINLGISGFVISKLKPGSVGWAWEKSVLETTLSKIDVDVYRPIMSGILCVHGERDTPWRYPDRPRLTRFSIPLHRVRIIFTNAQLRNSRS